MKGPPKVAIDGYYYLHKDGSLIWKNPIAVQADPDYFMSPFVKKVWECHSEDRGGAWTIALEALALGCPTARIKTLADKWGLTYEDSIELLRYVPPTELMKEGLDIFIKEIFGMEVKEYWDKVKVDWDKKVGGEEMGADGWVCEKCGAFISYNQKEEHSCSQKEDKNDRGSIPEDGQ